MRLLKSHSLLKLANNYLIDATQPSNISYLWNFGSLLAICLVIQIVTGVTLAMHYNASITHAFDSIEHIMRDVTNGWLVRYLHSNTASAFFFLVYLHIGRGIYYGSYRGTRLLVWVIGTIILICMMATGFLGYVLPYGQMSLWGATVITNLISAIPWIGQDAVEFIWGGFSVNNATLNRFFALHYLLPFVLAALVLMHLIALHDTAGSSNPLGVSGNYDRVTFSPYFIFKDLITVFIFIFGLSVFVFLLPNDLGDSDNYIMANPMQTPAAIVPEWYLLPFYAILRSIPNKLLGVIAMFTAIIAIILLYTWEKGFWKGCTYRPFMKMAYYGFVTNFMLLMWLGGKHVEDPYIDLGQIATAIYFLFFIFIVPVISIIENTLIIIAQERRTPQEKLVLQNKSTSPKKLTLKDKFYKFKDKLKNKLKNYLIELKQMILNIPWKSILQYILENKFALIALGVCFVVSLITRDNDPYNCDSDSEEFNNAKDAKVEIMSEDDPNHPLRKRKLSEDNSDDENDIEESSKKRKREEDLNDQDSPKESSRKRKREEDSNDQDNIEESSRKRKRSEDLNDQDSPKESLTKRQRSEDLNDQESNENKRIKLSDEQTNEQVNEQINEQTNEQVNESSNEEYNEQANPWENQEENEQTNEEYNEQSSESSNEEYNEQSSESSSDENPNDYERDPSDYTDEELAESIHHVQVDVSETYIVLGVLVQELERRGPEFQAEFDREFQAISIVNAIRETRLAELLHERDTRANSRLTNGNNNNNNNSENNNNSSDNNPNDF